MRINSEGLKGLNPDTWICVGNGISREAVKESILLDDVGFISDVVTDLRSLAIRILGEEVVLASATLRAEILERLVKREDIIKHFPVLRKLKRKKGFIQRLDQALQLGRKAYSSVEEASVLFERLFEKRGESEIQNEMRGFSSAYEAYLDALGLWDEVKLFKKVHQKMNEANVDLKLLGFPKKLLFIYSDPPESLENLFLEEIAFKINVERVVALENEIDLSSKKVLHNIWHTFDDAFFNMAIQIKKKNQFEDELILINDQPEIRRSLHRILNWFGIPILETRDPLEYRISEKLKLEFLPLRVVGNRFDRKSVIEWIHSSKNKFERKEIKEWNKEINRRAIRRGLNGYRGGKLSTLYSFLSELDQKFSGRLELLKLKEALKPQENSILSLFDQLQSDIETLNEENKKAPVLYWFHRLQNRAMKASPTVKKIKNLNGVEIHLMDQAPVWPQNQRKRIWVAGINEKYLNDEKVGDYFFSTRDRDILGLEFGLNHSALVRDLRWKKIKNWLNACDEIEILDSEFNYNGKERDVLGNSISSIFSGDVKTEKTGGHAYWARSFQTDLKVQDQKIKLVSFGSIGKNRVEATELDRMSRCSFQALSVYRWNLKNIREPELDIWPDVKGNLLHRSIELILLTKRDLQKKMSVKIALNRAWEELQPKGLIMGKHTEGYFKKLLLGILDRFLIDEEIYSNRAQTSIRSLEKEAQIELMISGVQVRGIPDRVDQNSDGIFILDYKSTTDLPTGKEMLDDGYRLQLPFYALAAREKFKSECLGVQYVSLGKKIGRSKGIFFKSSNGKEEGKLTNTRSRLSLFEQIPSEVWDKAKIQIENILKPYVNGQYEARPRKTTECMRCRMMDLCGRKRLWLAQGERVS